MVWFRECAIQVYNDVIGYAPHTGGVVGRNGWCSVISGPIRVVIVELWGEDTAKFQSGATRELSD